MLTSGECVERKGQLVGLGEREAVKEVVAVRQTVDVGESVPERVGVEELERLVRGFVAVVVPLGVEEPVTEEDRVEVELSVEQGVAVRVIVTVEEAVVVGVPDIAVI